MQFQVILCEARRSVMIGRMKPPPLRPTPDRPMSRPALRAGLRSPDAFTLRRCQILLASADGLPPRPDRRPPRLRLADRPQRHPRLPAAEGIDCLREKSHRPASARPELDDAACERLRALLHRSPRDFGKPTSLWTLGPGRRGRLRPGDHRAAGQRRDDPPGADAAGRRLEAGQDLDHQPRPGVPAKKGRATG